MAPRKPGGGEATPSLREVLSTLATQRATLDDLDTKLSETVRILEEKLRAHISTRVFTIMEAGQTPFDDTWQERLTFGKHDGQWQFLVESGEIDDPDNWKTQPLISASRETRVRVFTGGFMEKLVREAAQQLTAQIAERQNALKIASNLVIELEAYEDIPF